MGLMDMLSQMENNNKQFDFLLAGIADTQEIIRFTDTKAALAVVVLGGMMAVIFSKLSIICDSYCQYELYLKILLWVVLGALSIVVFYITRVVMPIHKVYGSKNIKPRFYIVTNKNWRYFLCPSAIKIPTSIKKHQEDIKKATESDINNSLICELYTVSYIRDVKSLRLHNLLVALSVSALFFIITTVILTIHEKV